MRNEAPVSRLQQAMVSVTGWLSPFLILVPTWVSYQTSYEFTQYNVALPIGI